MAPPPLGKLQKALHPPGELRVERFGWTFCPGDKVMQVANACDRKVYNGGPGVISGMDLEKGGLPCGCSFRSEM